MADTYALTDEQLNSIRMLAYDKFVARGCADGHDVEDWLAAEQEVQGCCAPTNGEALEPETIKRTRSSKSIKADGRETITSASKS